MATPSELDHEKAIKQINESMAFKGDFARWLIDEITAVDDSQVFWTDLNPLEAPADLTYQISSEGGTTDVRFGDSIKGERPVESKDRRTTYTLREPSVCALVLVVTYDTGSGGRVQLSAQSSTQDEILKLEDNSDAPGKVQKRIHIWSFKAITLCKMVGWYDPRQLARTAIDVLISTIFGRHSDSRVMEALVSGPPSDPPDYTHVWKEGPDGRDIPDANGAARKDIWVDYVGDVGDGWDSTYAVAHYLAHPELDIHNAVGGGTCRTKRGDILIFGGDQVYPAAERKQYRERLTQPYETALCSTSWPHPHAYAIPGNHDWYDSLVSFTRLFCQKRWLAGWQTNQSRSYFALKLPGKWWLLGTDVQLDSDIDVPQVEYFKAVAEKMKEDDLVIICTAEPHWVYATLYGKDDSDFNENNLAFLEKKIIGNKAKVAAFIAGDEHHYRRYQGKDGTQKITAGGGGAFLHPTHGKEAKILDGGFTLQPNSFPNRDESKKLGRRNLKFIKFNRWFGVLTAGLYLLTAWAVMADVGSIGLFNILHAVGVTLGTAMASPAAVFWIVAVFGGFWMFTDTHSKRFKLWGGVAHGVTHLLATFFIGWTAAYLSVSILFKKFGWTIFEFKKPGQLLFSAVFILFFGWIVGSFIMGIYLLISLNGFGHHANEAFSSLAIPDYKNFLRIRIEANGDLTIFPIGIRRVPRNWKRQPEDAKGPPYVSADNEATKPELIETPLYFKRSPDKVQRFGMVLSAERCLPPNN
jgi:hypothetical protein